MERDPIRNSPFPVAGEPVHGPRHGVVTRPGAHGLHLPGLAGAGDLLVQAPEQWMDWHIVLADGDGTSREFVDDSRARIRSLPGGWVDLDRCGRTSTMHLPRTPAPSEIAQPYLASTALVAAHWAGMPAFHAGAFVAHGKAWAVLGYKGAGKSSLLAALAQRGVPVLTDDLLIVSARLQGLAGPRCIDLREEAASVLGVGCAIGVVGGRERWRVRLDQVAAEVPLSGWIQLDWGEPDIRSVPPAERVNVLFASLALRDEPPEPGALSRLMALFALPMLRVRRPRNLEGIDESANELYGHIAGMTA